MPDILFNNSESDYLQRQNAEINQTSRDYWNKQNAAIEQKNAEYVENLRKYSVNIPQEQYNIIKDAIADAENPEDEAYRWASALELSKQYNLPVDYSYKNLEQINAAIWGDKYSFTPKTNFKAIVDNGHLGWNTLQMGKIGSKIMLAESAFNQGKLLADDEDLESLYKKYDEYEIENQSLQDFQDRNFIIECLKFGAQSFPFTGSVIAASAVGSLVAPGVGTAAAFATSMANAAGLQYMQMRKDGSSPESALGFSLVSGALQAVVETSLGNVAGALGRKSLGDLATEAVKQKITGNVFKRLVSDGTFKSLGLRLTKEYLKENFEEGLEEVWQDFIEKGSRALAAELGGYEIEGLDAQSIARDTWENFKGGVMGSLVLGLPTSAIKVNANVKEFADVRKAAELIPSQEAFNKATENSVIWEGMSDAEKREAQKNTWEKAQARIDAQANEEAKKIAEIQDAAEGSEELKTGDEEDGEEASISPVARDEESGKLYTKDEVYKDAEGNETGGLFVAGNENNLVEVNGEKKASRIGYIDWEFADGDQSKIIINAFKMGKGREGLREEFFNDFAIQHPGVDIQWNTKGSVANDIKQMLIDNNPSGKNNGLNYYADADAVIDAKTRAWLDREIDNNIYDVRKEKDQNGNEHVVKTKLTKQQRGAAIALLEAGAKRMGMSITDYVNKTFGNSIFGTREDFAKASLRQGEDVNMKAGGVKVGVAQQGWKQFGQQVKAVIYAGEHADFSTWAHELAHIFQNQLDGKLKEEAEAAFNVVDGDWENSMYTFKDGRVMPAAEAFAYGFQDWLKTGKAENEQMKNIFQKFAQFIARAYNSLADFIDLNPKITSVYEQLLAGDDSLLKAAKMAVEAEDRRYRAQMQKQAQEAEQQKQAEAEQQKKSEEAEREEASEATDFTEEQSTEEKLADAENRISEATNETEETDNAIDNALENTNLTDEQKEQIAETLKDESSTIVEKAEATTEAAESAYDDEAPIDLFQTDGGQRLLSQLAGEPSIRRMAKNEERERILTELDAAQLLDEKYKNMDAKSRAARIRRATGWEKDANGQWKYELDDSVNRIKTEFFKANPGILSGTPYLLNLGDILEADELYRVFPYMQNVRVSFYSDPNAFRAVLTPQGIKVNTRYLQGMNGETGLKGVLAHEIQHIIQAMEFADSKGLQGKDIEQLYNDVMKAMQAAGERKYNYDLTSLQQGLDAYMQDAGEIEARNVARRILMNADQRRMNTLASTEDVQRKILFQKVTENDLKERISSIKHTKDRQDYINRYYNNIKDQYEKVEVTSQDGKRKGVIEIAKDKDINEEKTKTEIDAALKFKSMGYEPTLLSENLQIDKGKKIDMLLNHEVLVEIKTPTGNANGIAKEIKAGLNKGNSEILSVFLVNNADITDEEIEKYLKLKAAYIKGESDGIYVFRNDDISEIKIPRVESLQTRAPGTSNIAQDANAVKQNEELDKKYFAAIESGNMDAVQKLVDQQAVKKGYTTPEDYKDAHAAPAANIEKNDFKNLDKLRELNDESWDVNLYAIAHGIMNVDPDYFVHPNRFGYGDDISMISATAINNVIRAIKAGKDDATITVYRAVPNSIKGNQLETSGQWVSPSREYAVNHGLARFGEGEFRIIEQEVPATDLWFDFGDIKEWGYDDGTTKNVYKNVPNNRKLNEPITYDEKGEIIPLSKRFDENNPSILFQVIGEIGAQNLDDAEVQEGVSRMQNLVTAKEMEKDHKTDKNIRLATGWEKGTDGKWRYEISDFKLKENPTWELKENEQGDYHSGKLSDLIDAPELFKAYPELKDYTVHTSLYSKDYLGQFSSFIEDISLNNSFEKSQDADLMKQIKDVEDTEEYKKYKAEQEAIFRRELNEDADYEQWEKDLDKLEADFYATETGAKYKKLLNTPRLKRNLDPAVLSTLIHEVQHAIQSIEGFAKGGNEETARSQANKTIEYSGDEKRQANWYSYYLREESAADYALQKKRIMKNPELIKKTGYWMAHSWAVPKKGTVEYTEYLYDRINGWMQETEAAIVRDDGYGRIFKDWYRKPEDELKKIRARNKYHAGKYRDLYFKIYNLNEKRKEYDSLSDYELYLRLAGEVESRNVEARMNFTPEQRLNTLLKATEDVAPNDKIILFQEVYHGSPHNFEKFSTENIGTGEGAQAFGWGLYFTNQEGIARFYADKLANEPARISLISKNEYLKSRKKSLRDVENKEKYEARINKNIKHFTKELKQAQKAGDESEIKFYEGLIDDSIKQLDEKERLSLVESFKKDIATAEQEIKELKASMKNNRNLYTVDIPDEGYLVWDKHVTPENIEGIKAALKDRGITDFTRIDNLVENQEKWKDNPNATYTLGGNFYKVISDYLGGDKEASLFLKDLGYIGIDYPANSFTGYTSEGERNYVIFDDADVNIKNHLLYQDVYHGSGADFDKFDTENFGLSGEGSMAFGYGTYLTDNEDIARDYAERQRRNRALNESNPYERGSLEREMYDEMLSFNFNKTSYKKYLEGIIEKQKANTDKPSIDSKAEEKLAKLPAISPTYLYTVEIPDDGYLEWNESISKDDVKNIVSKFVDFMLAQPSKNETKIHEVEDVDNWYWGNITGHGLYETLEVASSNRPQLVSQFLHSIGYAGIKYPAGTIHGNGNGAYNYVIFNDDDAKIVDKLLFQTNAELMDEARGFDSWQDFMEYCETFHADDDVSPIPGDAAAQWYQTFWEASNGVQVEQEKNEEAVQAKNKKDGMLPTAVDALFTTMIRSDPQMVDDFLHAVANIDAIDLDSEEWQQAENAEDAAQREQIDKLKDFIGITLKDYNWQTALNRIQGGHEISEGLRKRLIGEMTDSFKARDFRALYAEVMNDPQYAVAEEDSITAVLNKKLKKYHDIVKPTDDISRWSPERRKQLAEQLANKEIAAKIRNGSLKLDDELDAYIKSLNKQIKEAQDQYNELEKETKADYQRIADKERRDLLKLHEQLLLARGKLNSRNTEVNRKISKGLKITDKYSRITQNLNANYDEIFRKYNDLRNSITINAEVQAALDRQEQVAGLREDLNAKQKEKNLTAEIKKMRIQLVKKAMRRVPFNRIDYNNARTVIAIQRMLEPNLLGGVNRFIGIDSPYLRGVISQIVTDSDYKEKILNYLSKNAKASQAFADFKKKLTELKSIKDFDSWTAKDRKAAIRYLPKENWVKDLNLMQLAKEREESIDLDIGMEEVKRTVYDEKTGEPKTYKDNEGNERNVTETAFRLKYDEELGRLVQDAVGADMFDKIVNLPFSEWTTEDLESLAQRIDEIYTEGRDLKAAKDEARKKAAAEIRKRIEDAIKETGITINDDDTPEEKERKQKQIDKILGMSSDIKGTEAGKTKGLKARLNRLLHSYSDMNVMRFARMLDGQNEGENYRMLYRMEDDCYNKKQRSMNGRAEKIYKVMQDNNITEGDLAEVVKVPSLGTEFTVDELLYFLAADKDYVEDEVKLQKGELGLDANDDYAATSRNAVMFGNMMSDMMSQEEKESWLKLDKDMEEALQNDTLTDVQKAELALGQLDKKPGTSRYIRECHNKWGAVLAVANDYLNTHPQYKALMEAIEADYAEQYGRMNEVSINEFNMPVHRVKAYVPLVRRESNGDTNENQVREDLLGAAGVGKQWADRGMTQRRVQISPLNQKPVQTGLFRTWGDSIERTEHFIAYAPYIRQLNAVYKSRDAAYTRRFIESRYGDGAIKYLDEYINEVANPNAGRIRERGAEWLHVLRGKTAPAYLGWKASAIIKQGLTSPWPYMQFVNPAEYFSAAMKFTFNPQMREAIKEKSVFMKMRRMDPVNDLIDEMADNAKTKLDRGWSNFSKLGMQGLELIDWACVAPGWLACYEKKYNQLQNASNARYEAKMAELKERNMYADVGTSEYLTPEQMEAEAKKEILEDIETEAVRYADDCTRACQPSNRVTDLAPLFKNSSEAMKAFLQFQTSLNVIWQNLRYDMPYAVKNKEFTRIAGTVIGYVCAGIFMNSVMEGLGGDDDDDEKQALRNLVYYSTTQFTDAIPIMGSEITNMMDQFITGKRGFASSGTDMTPSATKLLSALTTAKKGNWQKAAELTAEGIGLYLGAPVSGAKEINKLLGKPLKEGDVNLARGISDVYGIAGDILEE